MKRISQWVLAAMLTMMGVSPLSAQGNDKEPDLQALYQEIDDAIEHSPQYIAHRLGQIDDLHKLLLDESSLEKRLTLAERLFALYKPYKNDSALYFADLCVALADSLQQKNKVGLYLSLKAHQCSNVGMYVESLDLLKKIDKQSLEREGLTKYYAAWMHVCGEIGAYSQLEDERLKYFALQDGYRDSVLAVAEEGSEEYLHLKMDVLCARQQYQDALTVSDKWFGKVSNGTHEYAYAAFYRSVVYDKLGNKSQLRYWLGKSALDDIKCAVNDQASLFMLAERLCEDGDYNRAYRYVRFCENCNTVFSPQLRNYQVRYVANVMKASYQNSEARYSRLLMMACAVGLLLLGLVIWLLIKKGKK